MGFVAAGYGCVGGKHGPFTDFAEVATEFFKQGKEGWQGMAFVDVEHIDIFVGGFQYLQAGPAQNHFLADTGPFVPVEGAMPAEAWQDGLVTALSTGAPWGDWPDDLDARATSIARMLVGRWGRVRT